MKKIIIYTTRFCGYCNAAKKWFEQKGLEYQEIRLYEGNEMEKFREAYPELRTSP
ncbi:MAG: glutaredoxin domain-containing protein, partial [SAR324 cluster bacterium]|nr:glutaredoxin domain-containing protein [SAR324 cluster bacterium]